MNVLNHENVRFNPPESHTHGSGIEVVQALIRSCRASILIEFCPDASKVRAGAWRRAHGAGRESLDGPG
jgi:hypothetical protein